MNGKFKGKSTLDIWLVVLKEKVLKFRIILKIKYKSIYEIEYVIKKNFGEIYVSSVSGLDIYINGFPLVLGEKYYDESLRG